MKIKDILNLWGGWNSPDVFEIWIKSRNENVKITALELIEGQYGELNHTELIRFGTSGKKQDGHWEHYLWIK